MHCTEKVRRRLASWLCILFIGYTAATSFFYHAHYVNGRWIVHSHPYTQAPETGHHTHTQAGFATLACLTAALMTSIAPTLYTEPFTCLSAVIIEAVRTALVSQELLHLSLRGPPTHSGLN